jgi:hypothetical protein
MREKGYLVVIGLFLIALTSIAHADNLALTGIATQSSTIPSTYGNGEARNAIDGNTDGDFDASAHSVTHTWDVDQPWWMVDLGANYHIDGIVIWNRTDEPEYVPQKLTNFKVSILDSASQSVWSADYFTSGGYPNPSLSISLPANTTGEFVKVMLNGTNFLHFAEVQVYEGAPVPLPPGFWLFGSGLVGLIGLRRFRKS